MSYDLDELERLERAATPGPVEFCRYESTDRDWLVQEYRDLLDASPNGTVYFVGTAEDKVAALTGNGPKSAENARLFAKVRNALPAMIRDLREAKEKLHLFEYAVDAAKDGGSFTADGWTMINSKLHSDLLVAKEQIKGAVELLREVEWAYIEGVGNECPHCKRDRDVPSLIDGRIGHAPDCKLKKWLARQD